MNGHHLQHLLAALPSAINTSVRRGFGSGSARFNLTLAELNHMYNHGTPSNAVSLVGLLVHQHDNTEGESESHGVFKPGPNFQHHWATSIISRRLPGLYNEECGIIIAPGAVHVLCSYYADFVSWTTGCMHQGLLAKWGGNGPSQPRDSTYPPNGLSKMLEMSEELQSRFWKERLEREVGPGSGQPAPIGGTGWDFQNGQYNEVLIHSKFYEQSLPHSVAAVFYLAHGSNDGRWCAFKTRNAIEATYGLPRSSVMILKHTRGVQGKAFELDEGNPPWSNGRPEH